MNLRSAVVLLLSSLPLLAQSHDTYQGHDVVANQVLVKLTSASTAVLQQLRQLADADDVRPLNGALQIYVLHSRSGNLTALMAILRAHPSVGYVEPDYFVKTVSTPSDPGFPQQWALRNTSLPGADIGATPAWDVSTGSTANVVGVVDTGIDYTHADLAANIWSAPSAFTVRMSWGQVNCPAGSHGYNAIARSCDPRDDNQHGTHVSGTIGAAGNNGLGVAGVSWSTRIMGLKFLDSTGSGSTSDAIDAIEFSIQAKAAFGAGANVRVLSNSWGGAGYSQALLDEINRASANEMLFVVAAGNSSANTDTSPQYPAAYNAANLISVAATTNSDTLASFSNYGRTTISLGAPGVDILSTLPGGGYGYMSGTSMATPHVSGAAMLVLSRCGLNTAGLKSTLLGQVDLLASLAGITVTGGRLNVNKALRSCAGVTSPPEGSAGFVRSDTGTAGNWKGVYGGDGSVVIGDSSSVPGYAALSAAGNSAFTWAGSTSDARAPQKAAATDRVAACWFAQNAFTIDLRFSDGNSHQVALYLLDWDNYGGGRTERVEVLDGGTGAALDTRQVSGFAGGQYLVWNLSGHVVLRVTNTNGAANAVVSAVLFGGTGGATAPGGSASFLKVDGTTGGTWKGTYGSDGASVIGDGATYPAYVSVTPAGVSQYTWAGSTADGRAMQKLTASDRIAGCWFTSGVMSVDLRFSDANNHAVALYLLDWDNYGGGRTEKVEVLDGATGAVLDSRSAYGFVGGQYLVWSLSGHVVIRVTNTNGAANAVVSGLLFGGGAANSAAFVRSDGSTGGSWRGVYGLDGANVIGDGGSYPAYASVTASGNSQYTWAGSTGDSRALQKFTAATDRIASCWFSAGAFSMDVRLGDGNAHQVAVYFLDWDGYVGGRTELIEVLDGATGALLDSRTVSGFTGGVYLVWNLSGHVVIRVTNTNAGANAVASGVFFR